MGPAAVLVLEDGSVFRGTGFGARGEAFGEAVFNTSMAGYQEVLTDPSYAGQVVAMTAPHQGNYGTNPEDAESDGVKVAGFVVREASRRPSSWRAVRTLQDDLAEAGVVGLEGVDTRRLTLRLRERGAMRCGVSTEDLDPASLLVRVRSSPGMEGADLAAGVSTPEPYEAAGVVGRATSTLGRVFRVAAYDFGLKRNILRRLAAAGIETTVFPARTPPSHLGDHDGVFLSNGPGDPAATRYGIAAARALLGTVPVFGICLGHQLLALALGGRTFKMPFGHRGANQPVRDRRTGRVEVTSHNHGFAVDAGGWDPDGDAVRTRFGRAELTHWNLNDGTLEGLRCLDVPALSVQYHPEAAPGPRDAGHLFGEFRGLMEAG
ncbi:MAG TPA: glutamine-hydrolyzing carbamoyl-phosphate synthase small subunit [Actinomycetota bacterium]|jgi:carbamoyl-phosphate synthase small subunit